MEPHNVGHYRYKIAITFIYKTAVLKNLAQIEKNVIFKYHYQCVPLSTLHFVFKAKIFEKSCIKIVPLLTYILYRIETK